MKDNPVAAGVVSVPRSLVETVTTIANRNEQSSEGDALASLLSASPVQAGIDPLVAEIEALRNRAHNWRNNSDKARVSVPLGEIRTILAGYRSQAERIAALERFEANATKSITDLDMALGKTLRERAAAESLLAEAREALEKAHRAEHRKLGEMLAAKDEGTNWQGGKVNGLATALATLSRLKPGEKGGAS